ncbi:MAG: hypothetical protein WKF89_08705, partial [Chitinophagaceae bacterium]
MKNQFVTLLVLLFCCNLGAQIPSLAPCNTWTFQLGIASAQSEQPLHTIHLPTGSYIICGNDSAASGTHGRLLKLSSQGRVELSKQLSYGSQNLTVKKVRLFSNGLLYGLALATDPLSGLHKPLLFTADTASLTIRSVMEYRFSVSAADWLAADLDEGRDNSTFLFLYNDSLVNVTKLGLPLNTITWSRTYRTRNRPRPVGMEVEYNELHLAWNETDSGYNKGVVISLDFATGNYRFGSRVGGLGKGL